MSKEKIFKITEIDSVKVFSVLLLLWVVPIAEVFDDMSYGSAIANVMLSFVLFAAGVVIANNLSDGIKRKIVKPSLIVSVICLVHGWSVYRIFMSDWITITRILSMLLLGLSLGMMKISYIPKNFKLGVGILFFLSCSYVAAIYCSRFVPFHFYTGVDIESFVYLMIRVAIVFLTWRTLSMDCVAEFLGRRSGLTKFVGGLFWGIFPVWGLHLSIDWSVGTVILLLIISPLFACVFSVVFRIVSGMIKCLVEEVLFKKEWWMKNLCWWRGE